MPAIIWKVAAPFILPLRVLPEHLDDYQHTNNVIYLQWLEQVAWAHSAAIGFDMAAYQRMGCGFVVRRHELDYLLPTHVGDELQLATWISANDGKLSTTRDYQLCRVRDGKTILTARTLLMCVDTRTGKARRMPPEFVAAYAPVPVLGTLPTDTTG